jgi:5-methylcytosine-specific restriction endonuclease McrA
MKLSDMMPHADLPPWTEYLEAWEKEHKPVYQTLDECLHESTVMTQKIDTLGRDHYYFRCTICGRRAGTIKKRDALKTLAGVVPPDDEHITAQIRLDPDNERTRMRSYLRAEYVWLRAEYPKKLIELKRIYYDKYRNTARWMKLRASVFERDNHTCQSCGSTDFLHCHHNTYVRLSVEDMSDLITYCARCHKNHHIDQDMEREREQLWRENQLTINQQLSE